MEQDEFLQRELSRELGRFDLLLGPSYTKACYGVLRLIPLESSLFGALYSPSLFTRE